MNDGFSDWLANRKDDTPAPMLADGEIVGDYAIVGFLGRGGSGEVYRGEHRFLKTPVAIKVLHRGDEAGKARFLREAEILADRQYPGFPRFFAYGEADGRPYLVTELLEERPLPSKESEIAEFIRKVAAAVGELHKLGYVHRDIKPSNILWRSPSEPVLIDFGLAKPVADGGPRPALNTLSIENGRAVGVGTPGYAAPEQFVSGEIGFSADIHALGVLANECFGGNPPKGWVQIIHRATSSIKAQRPENIAEFIKAINMRHRRRLPIFVPVVAAAIVVVCIFVLQRRIDAYVKNNALKWWLMHGDKSLMHVVEPFLLPEAGVDDLWRALGNADLLDGRRLVSLRISRKVPELALSQIVAVCRRGAEEKGYVYVPVLPPREGAATRLPTCAIPPPVSPPRKEAIARLCPQSEYSLFTGQYSPSPT